MRNHALQFIPGQVVHGTFSHADDGIAGRVAGRKRVDGGFSDEVDRWHGCARGDRHFLDHIQQFFSVEIATGVHQQFAAKHLCYSAAAAFQ